MDVRDTIVELNQVLSLRFTEIDYAKVRRLISDNPTLDVNQLKDIQRVLHLALVEKDFEFAEYLLNKRFARVTDVTSEDSRGTTLMLACEIGNLNLCELLVAKGANVNAYGRSGRFPLMLASAEGHLNICEFLISKGADPNRTDTQYGRTALMDASSYGRLNVCEFLESEGANVHAKDCYGKNALMRASMNGALNTCAFLESKGADVNAKSKDGKTALVFASEAGHLGVCQFLVSKGADVNIKADHGETALSMASQFGRSDENVSRFLVESGAQWQSEEKRILLYSAGRKGLRLLKTLVLKGANIDLLCHESIEHYYPEAQKYLRKNASRETLLAMMSVLYIERVGPCLLKLLKDRDLFRKLYLMLENLGEGSSDVELSNSKYCL
jgi:ankyrin repeat protein